MARFGVDDLINCYRHGVFPMGEGREDEGVYLVDPTQRCIMPLEHFHVPRRLARTIRSERFTFSIDRNFDQVLALCAAPNGPERKETWINDDIRELYNELFRRGLAHSVETWEDGVLAGGLYGVGLGGAFFGESMFSLRRDGSKAALVHLAARLRMGGYELLDAQFTTPHLEQFGAETLSRAEFRERLASALELSGDFKRMPESASGAQLLQSIAQIS